MKMAGSGIRGVAACLWLAALEQAVASGFDDAANMKVDEDLASLRDSETFAAVQV